MTLTEEESAERAMSALEGLADVWTAEVNLAAMIETLAQVARNLPADVSAREHFVGRLSDQISALCRQSFIEGSYRAHCAAIDSLRAERRTPGTVEVCSECGGPYELGKESGAIDNCPGLNDRPCPLRQPQEAK